MLYIGKIKYSTRREELWVVGERLKVYVVVDEEGGTWRRAMEHMMQLILLALHLFRVVVSLLPWPIACRVLVYLDDEPVFLAYKV